MAEQLRTHENETVDALCWRHYGRTAGVVEAVLEANPGLADQGPLLPAGLLVSMPDIQVTAQVAKMVQLWD